MYIKRGRSSPMTPGAADLLRQHDKLAQLLPAVQRNMRIQRDCNEALPDYLHNCQVVHFQDGQLSFSAPNAALAAKFRQIIPNLQAQLVQRGWQINAIRIKVQVKPQQSASRPVKQLRMPGVALQAFQALNQELEQDPHNSQLSAALQNLLARHARKPLS